MINKFRKYPRKDQLNLVYNYISECAKKNSAKVNKVNKNTAAAKMADGKATLHAKRKITDPGNLNPVSKMQKALPQRPLRISTEMLDREYKQVIMKAQNDIKFRPILNASRLRKNSSNEADKDG